MPDVSLKMLKLLDEYQVAALGVLECQPVTGYLGVGPEGVKGGCREESMTAC
jgi:hypothetical protein